VAEPVAAVAVCAGCGSDLAPSLLVCPACQRLVHAEELKALAGEAESLGAHKVWADAADRWQRALALLPPGTRQREAVSARYADALSRSQASGARPPAPSKMPKALAGLGAVGLLLWKLKFLATFLALKLPTILSFAASFGVYWAAWGWKFALGFLLLIYVHEMGHVTAARRAGLPVTSPMFIPGVGAFIRLQVQPRSPEEEARIGLAGPVFGLAATAVCATYARATGSELIAALAHASALINLFNLVPIWQLDGSRAFRALNRTQQLLAAASLAGAWLITDDGLVLLLAIVAGGRALTTRGRAGNGYWAATGAFCFTALALAQAAAWLVPLLAHPAR